MVTKSTEKGGKTHERTNQKRRERVINRNEKNQRHARRFDLSPLNPKDLAKEDCDDLIAAIYNRSLEDYKKAFLKLKSLEQEEGKEAEKNRWQIQLEEASAFMRTGGGYAINPDTVEKIAKCFEAFCAVTESM